MFGANHTAVPQAIPIQVDVFPQPNGGFTFQLRSPLPAGPTIQVLSAVIQKLAEQLPPPQPQVEVVQGEAARQLLAAAGGRNGTGR